VIYNLDIYIAYQDSCDGDQNRDISLKEYPMVAFLSAPLGNYHDPFRESPEYYY